MLFHTSKLPAGIGISHLNARINERKKKNCANYCLTKILSCLQLTQRLSKEARARKKTNEKIYVLDFNGGTAASAVASLREEITLIFGHCKSGRDRVVLRLESPGGMVHGYGSTSQLVAYVTQVSI